MPAKTAEIRHWHRMARQFFYVVDGELRVEVEGTEHRLYVGQGLEIAPGRRHEVRNDGVAEARFLVVSQPASHGDRVVDV